MGNLSPKRETLQGLVDEADARLQNIDHSPFSSAAFSVFKEKVSDYIVQLFSESMNVSKRHQADTISPSHVERASEYLVSSATRRFFRHVGTIGGVLLGASLSNILAMTVAGQSSILNAILTAAFGMIGAFMIALHMAKD